MTAKDMIKQGDLLADGFDDCIIGVATILFCDKEIRRVIYSADQIIESLARDISEAVHMESDKPLDEDTARESAMEYFEFNILGAHVGMQTPIYLWDATDQP